MLLLVAARACQLDIQMKKTKNARMSKKNDSKVYKGDKFSETAPRPPVPGEENDVSTSRRSSHALHRLEKDTGSSKGYTLPSHAHEVRPSKLDEADSGSAAPFLLDGGDSKDMDAPEGSVANTPLFTETCTPPYLKWAENFNYLLDDHDGVRLFQNFLFQEAGGASTLEFWFACQGLKKLDSTKQGIPHLIKVINKKFIRGDQLLSIISNETKRDIAEKIKKTSSDQYIFDPAQVEVENYMRNNTYPLFLKSDLYVQYVQHGGKSSKGSSNSSSGSSSARPVSVPLPALPEDQELNTVSTAVPGPLPLKTLSKYSREANSPWRTETISGLRPYLNRNHSAYPHHTSYAPGSAQDSELHSVSSEATTDDTVSVTDSSVDGIPVIHTKSYHGSKHRKSIRRRAEQNQESKDAAIHQQFIPRTERAPKDRNIAEVYPEKFADMLIEKLEKIQLEQEREEKLRESFRVISESEEVEEGKATNPQMLNPLIPMIPLDDNLAQSILEEHCSRIWESSAQQTPCRSPGRHSPKSKSPDRAHRKNVQGQLSIPVSQGHGKVHKKKDKDFHSMWSCDSGMGEEKPNTHYGETHKHFYHHHHHHHHSTREGKSRQQIEIEAQQHSMTCYLSEAPARGHAEHHQTHKDSDRGRSHIRKSNVRKHSDATSNIDSGISTIYEKDSLPHMPNLTDPTSEKVIQWIMASDKFAQGGTAHTDSDKGSSHKRGHKMTMSTTGSPQLQKQSLSKKSAMLTSRSASAERSGMASWLPSGNSQIMPSQPFIQDPSMPLLTPPNPTTQLEEAKRRLEDQTRSLPVKSKSFGGVPSRDKRSQATTQNLSQVRTLPTTKTVPCDLDISGEGSALYNTEKKSKRSFGSSTAPGSSEETVIGYYFCGDPIPYRHMVPGKVVTLSQFKNLITKRGSYRYFFKKSSNDFESSGVVFDEITDDNAILPLWEGKVVAKVEKKE